MFNIATKVVSQHTCLDFSDVGCLDMDRSLGLAGDVRNTVTSLNNLVGYVSERFPGILKES